MRAVYTVREIDGAHEPAQVRGWHEGDAAETAVQIWYGWHGDPLPYHVDVLVDAGGDAEPVPMRVHLSHRLHVQALPAGEVAP